MEAQKSVISATGGSLEHPLAPLVHRWYAAINAGKKYRKDNFDNVADEARQYFDGDQNYMWKKVADTINDQQNQGFIAGTSLTPQFKMQVNRMFDAVSLFGPALYHQNPTIAVTPRSPLSVSIDTFYAHSERATQLVRMIPDMQRGLVGDPSLAEMAMQLQEQYETAVNEGEMRTRINRDHAIIIETLSNYYQNETHKQDECREAITEAIITGLGLIETEWAEPPGGGPAMPVGKFISNRQFIADPDACYWRDVTWIAIKRESPVNMVESKFNLPPGTLKGMYAANTAYNSGINPEHKKDGDGKLRGLSHDIVEYWDVYSKNGAGQRLKISDNARKIEGLEGLGDFVYLAICPKCPYPLNIPKNMPISDPVTGEVSEQALQATSWPAPFWDDAWSDGGWPVSRLIFHTNPGKLWPVSMCKPVLPLIRFVNWCMSFLADGVAAGSKIYPAMLKRTAESIRSQLADGNGPFTPIELEEINNVTSINDLITFLQAPTFNIDIYKMVEMVNQAIDKGLGLTELLYGLSSRQMRSAAEADHKQENLNIRPDDMATRVEDFLAVTAAREIQLLRWRGSYDDVEPIVGPVAAHVFETQILNRDVSAVTREFSYRVEAGSARKPNKQTKIQQLQDLSQYLLPVAQQAMQMGISRPFNAFMEDYGRATDQDPTRYMVDQEELQQMLAMQAALNNPMPPEAEDSGGANG